MSPINRGHFILLAAFSVAIAVIAFTVVPQFRELYLEMGVVLPFPTSLLVSGYAILGSLGCVFAAIGIIGAARQPGRPESAADVTQAANNGQRAMSHGLFIAIGGLIIGIIVTVLFWPLMRMHP